MTPDRAADAARFRRETRADPADRVAWHNLAAAEGDLGRQAEAEDAARRAISLGIPAPETRLVLARALLHQGHLDEAEQAFEQALAISPAYAQAHRDLAQLRWMRSGNVAEALRALDRSLGKDPGEPGLHLVRSIVLEFVERRQEALEAAREGLRLLPADLQLLRQAAHLSSLLGDSLAVPLALRAVAASASERGAELTLCEALLGAGRVREAEVLAGRLCTEQPHDQLAVALRSTAWRLLRDSRYEALHDYAALVGAEVIQTPRGWSHLADFLRELATELEGLHQFRAHPFQQSVRGGGQVTLDGPALDLPTLQALFASIHLSIDHYLRRVGLGADPFRARNSGAARIVGSWSVRLRSGGHHTDHVHPRGWLSSAFYVDLPPAVVAGSGQPGDRAGWLRLGCPGVATKPPLSPDGFVKPVAGSLALFPAYLWHGVEPFDDSHPRLTVAFDALPA